jgi:phosphate-selective porin OprO/OprP
VLTGEPASDTGVRPRANFEVEKGNWGAVQIAARYHALRVDDAARTAGFAAAGASLKAEAWTLGVNWYLTPNVRYLVNLERTVFDDKAEGARPAENAFVFRTQLSF